MSATDLYIDGPLSTGVPEIDAEHAQLHVMAAELDHVLMSNSDKEIRLEKHRDLYEAFLRHFANEESIMAKIGVESLNEHKKQHQELVKSLAKLGESITKEHERLVTEKFVAVEKMLVMHVAALDTDIRHYLHLD
jgi:hemerythrin-like metal-binding protein